MERRVIGRFELLALTGVLAVGAAATSGCGSLVAQPPQPSGGYGSTAGYVSPGGIRYSAGSASAGTRVWWFVPDRLRDGDSAPVVVYLHGFQLADPRIYAGHIRHLVREGLIVVFPQINKSGVKGLLSDTDQNAMLRRAVAATNVGLDRLGEKADRSRVYIFGHSLGALLGAAWASGGGAPVQSLVLANPSLDSSRAIPAFARSLMKIRTIDHAAAAAKVRAPAIILTGDKDTIARPREAELLYDELLNAADRVVYRATSDATGRPAIVADHLAPTQDNGPIPRFMAPLFGGAARLDTLDYRFYWAALDAAIDGRTRVDWQMGTWSDGTAVAAPVQLRP